MAAGAVAVAATEASGSGGALAVAASWSDADIDALLANRPSLVAGATGSKSSSATAAAASSKDGGAHASESTVSAASAPLDAQSAACDNEEDETIYSVAPALDARKQAAASAGISTDAVAAGLSGLQQLQSNALAVRAALAPLVAAALGWASAPSGRSGAGGGLGGDSTDAYDSDGATDSELEELGLGASLSSLSTRRLRRRRRASAAASADQDDENAEADALAAPGSAVASDAVCALLRRWALQAQRKTRDARDTARAASSAAAVRARRQSRWAKLPAVGNVSLHAPSPAVTVAAVVPFAAEEAAAAGAAGRCYLSAQVPAPDTVEAAVTALVPSKARASDADGSETEDSDDANTRETDVDSILAAAVSQASSTTSSAEDVDAVNVDTSVIAERTRLAALVAARRAAVISAESESSSTMATAAAAAARSLLQSHYWAVPLARAALDKRDHVGSEDDGAHSEGYVDDGGAAVHHVFADISAPGRTLGFPLPSAHRIASAAGGSLNAALAAAARAFQEARGGTLLLHFVAPGRFGTGGIFSVLRAANPAVAEQFDAAAGDAQDAPLGSVHVVELPTAAGAGAQGGSKRTFAALLVCYSRQTRVFSEAAFALALRKCVSFASAMLLAIVTPKHGYSASQGAGAGNAVWYALERGLRTYAGGAGVPAIVCYYSHNPAARALAARQRGDAAALAQAATEEAEDRASRIAAGATAVSARAGWERSLSADWDEASAGESAAATHTATQRAANSTVMLNGEPSASSDPTKESVEGTHVMPMEDADAVVGAAVDTAPVSDQFDDHAVAADADAEGYTALDPFAALFEDGDGNDADAEFYEAQAAAQAEAAGKAATGQAVAVAAAEAAAAAEAEALAAAEADAESDADVQATIAAHFEAEAAGTAAAIAAVANLEAGSAAASLEVLSDVSVDTHAANEPAVNTVVAPPATVSAHAPGKAMLALLRAAPLDGLTVVLPMWLSSAPDDMPAPTPSSVFSLVCSGTQCYSGGAARDASATGNGLGVVALAPALSATPTAAPAGASASVFRTAASRRSSQAACHCWAGWVFMAFPGNHGAALRLRAAAASRPPPRPPRRAARSCVTPRTSRPLHAGPRGWARPSRRLCSWTNSPSASPRRPARGRTCRR